MRQARDFGQKCSIVLYPTVENSHVWPVTNVLLGANLVPKVPRLQW